jgi:hypothetical protein
MKKGVCCTVALVVLSPFAQKKGGQQQYNAGEIISSKETSSVCCRSLLIQMAILIGISLKSSPF